MQVAISLYDGGRRKGVGVRRRAAGGESRMKESYTGRPSQSPWPRVMRVVGQPAGRRVHRGTTGRCRELRTHLAAVADLVLTRGRHSSCRTITASPM
jgi:hypothetical protein